MASDLARHLGFSTSDTWTAKWNHPSARSTFRFSSPSDILNVEHSKYDTPARLNFSVVDDPSHDPSIQINYPKGSYRSPSSSRTIGGAQFYTNPLDPLQRGLLTYDLFLPQNFPFHLGGKFPGLSGDLHAKQRAESCSGGIPSNGTNCWSVRLMWRTNGQGEVQKA